MGVRAGVLNTKSREQQADFTQNSEMPFSNRGEPHAGEQFNAAARQAHTEALLCCSSQTDTNGPRSPVLHELTPWTTGSPGLGSGKSLSPSQLMCRRKTHTGPSNPDRGQIPSGAGGKNRPKDGGWGAGPRAHAGLRMVSAPPSHSDEPLTRKTQNGAVSAVGPSSPD